MSKQGSSPSYWFERDSGAPSAEPTPPEPERRRIPSPLNLFARRLRQREEPVAVPADADEPVVPIHEVMQRIAAEREQTGVAAIPDGEEDELLAIGADLSAGVPDEAADFSDDGQDLPADEAGEVKEAPVPAEALLQPLETEPDGPEKIAEAVPVSAGPPAADEPAPAPVPMTSERVVIEPVAAHPDTAEPADPGVPSRRTSRVKTTFLGFERSDGRIEDVFQKVDEAAAATATATLFPVGWLAIVEGPGRGHSIALQAGVSQIGRGEDQAIQLNYGDMAISRQNHAAIAFDHEDRRFYIGHGGKANIVRLNGKPVLSTETLEHGDRIKIGETTLQFAALCGADFHWTA
jgi:hypothetical protein